MKSKNCTLRMSTMYGQISEPIQMESIRKAVEFAKGSGYFYYYIFVEGKQVKCGHCRD